MRGADGRDAVRREDEAAAPRARVEPALWVALAASLASAAMLAPEWLLAPPQLNDNVLHVALARYAAEHWSEHWPVDHWFPSIAAGFPVFAHYPHLPHLVSAALAWRSPPMPGRSTSACRALARGAPALDLLLGAAASAFPRSRGRRGRALPAALLEGLLRIGWDSYVWRTHGLSVQLWGTFFLFPALGWGFRAIRSGDGWYAAGLLLGACILAHFLLGYVATVSLLVLAALPDRSVPAGRRLLRLARVGAVAAAATAYFTVPFLLYRGELLRSRWEPEWKWSSMGWRWLLPRLFRGEIFDGDSLPILSLRRARSRDRHRRHSARLAPHALRSFSEGGRSFREGEDGSLGRDVLRPLDRAVLGRPTLGRLVDALPFASGSTCIVSSPECRRSAYPSPVALSPR